MSSPGRMLMGSHHSGVDPDRPLRALFAVGIPAQLIQDPRPAAVG
jgi:hypothetical protein